MQESIVPSSDFVLVGSFCTLFLVRAYMYSPRLSALTVRSVSNNIFSLLHAVLFSIIIMQVGHLRQVQIFSVHHIIFYFRYVWYMQVKEPYLVFVMTEPCDCKSSWHAHYCRPPQSHCQYSLHLSVHHEHCLVLD